MQVTIRDIICDSEQRYSCSSCESSCCYYFSVTIDEKTKNKYENDDYIELIMQNASVKFENKDEHSYYIPKVLNNAEYKCVFLDQNNICSIHKEKGYHYKPVICQSFPFSMYFDSENNIHVETSFVCESILLNKGELLEDFKTDLILNYVNHEFYPPVYIIEKASLPQHELFELIKELKQILDNTDKPLNDCIIEYSSCIYYYKQLFIANGFVELSRLRDIVRDEIDKNSYSHSKYEYITKIYLASLILYSFYKPNNPLFKNVFKLMYSYISLLIALFLRLKKFSMPYGFESLNLSSLNKVKFTYNTHIDLLIRRYLKSNLFRYKYAVYYNDNLSFLNLVVIFYMLIHMYSKFLVIIMNKQEVDYNIVKKSIKTIEFVFYHLKNLVIPSKFINSLVISHVNKLLTEPSNVKSLLKGM